MGERLESFEFRKGKNAKYPWGEWTDGSVWRIRQGEDFECSITTMAQSLYHRAVRFPFTVQVHKEDDHTLVFKFTPKEKPTYGDA